MSDNFGTAVLADPLVSLVQEKNFVGWVYSLDYDVAKIITNDLWKSNVLGVPLNCFLVAATFDPKRFNSVAEADREILLLRVVGAAQLPQDDDMIRTKVDYFQQQTEIFAENGGDYDDLTRSMMQFSGLECRVLGTFYKQDDSLWLGSDLESFASAVRFNVYKPRAAALETIVNYVDPIRLQAAREEVQTLGLTKPVKPFTIGTVRYTSTARLHRGSNIELVSVALQPSDFLARRTAVLGMTRTGKSNMVKQLVSVVKRVADEGGIKIGQIIYDLNGEYANANQIDRGALADIYTDGQTVRYRMLQTEGFEELQNNFYAQLNEGFKIIRQMMLAKRLDQGDMEVFLSTSLDEPDRSEEGTEGLRKRWQIRVAAYQALLHKAGFPAPRDFRVQFDANMTVMQKVQDARPNQTFRHPKDGLSLDEAVDWFLAARDANGGDSNKLLSSSKKPWLENDVRAMLNLIAKRNDSGTFIKGHSNLVDAIPYHSERRAAEVGDEIYEHLCKGRIVILDLSVGNPELRERISKQIAADIFNKSMDRFVKGQRPPNVVVYIEEAHNLIGKGMDLTETWPRLAKEGAKYRIALVYATQEVSSVHPNILANTENWFITHLNNKGEIRELEKFYDFEDFGRSLIRAQDVGFARVKTLSGPFVIPVQIDKFDPEAERARLAKSTIRPSLFQ